MYKSRFTGESFDSYEDEQRVSTLFKIELEKRLGGNSLMMRTTTEGLSNQRIALS
jgi:hypothetical protein